jgi:hypothetical protein
MPVRINPNYCVGCNKWEWAEELVKDGVYYYHITCLERLQAGLVKPDKAMFQQLSKAFGSIEGL